MKKICLLKLREEDLPFKAPLFVFKQVCVCQGVCARGYHKLSACTFGWKSASECCSVKYQKSTSDISRVRSSHPNIVASYVFGTE